MSRISKDTNEKRIKKKKTSFWKEMTKVKGIHVYKIMNGLQNEYSLFLTI